MATSDTHETRPRDPAWGTIDAERLGTFETLAGVSLAARMEILRDGVLRRLEPGEVLLTPGRTARDMYLVLDGRLDVYLDSLDGDTVAVISSGETVGELSVLDGSPTSAYVVAKRPCQLLALDETAFWNLINNSHAFAVNLLIKFAQRLRANNATVTENARQRRRYERAAMFDGLTGIHNRRWLDEMLERLVKRQTQLSENQPQLAPCDLSLAIADIDHFKGFNDTFGHAAGDFVLTTVANTLGQQVRATDLIARFGGEEFVIIFPDTDLAHAVSAAERIRKAVATLPLRLPDHTELPPVTISLGVARLRDRDSVATFLCRADQALYRAKENGRNRVEYA